MQTGFAHADAERHARCNAFGDADDIGLDTGVLNGPPLPCPARAGLHLIRNHQDAVTVADAANLLQEVCRSDDVSSLTLNGLEDDRSDLLGRQNRLEELLFDVARAVKGKRLFLLRPAAASAIGIGIAHVMHAGNERSEAALLLRLRGGQRKRSHRAAVKGAEEADDVLPARVVSGKLHSALDRLGAGVAVVEPVRAGHGRNGAQPLCKLDHVLVVEVCPGHMQQLAGLLLDCLDHLGMTMARGVHGNAGGEVQELIAIDVGDAEAAAGLRDQRIAAGVAGRQQPIVVGDNLLCERAGDGGLQIRAILGERRFSSDAGVLLRQDAHWLSPWLAAVRVLPFAPSLMEGQIALRMETEGKRLRWARYSPVREERALVAGEETRS